MLIALAVKKIWRSRVFLIGVGCSVFFAVLLALRAWGLYSLSREREEANAELVAINRNSRSAYHLDRDLRTAQAMAEEIDSRLVSASREAYNLRIFYALERLTQVRVQDSDQVNVSLFAVPKNKKKAGESDDADAGDANEDKVVEAGGGTVYQVMTFSMHLEGSFLQLMDFLYKLRVGAPFTRITSLDMWVPDESGRQGVLHAQLTVDILGKED